MGPCFSRPLGPLGPVLVTYMRHKPDAYFMGFQFGGVTVAYIATLFGVPERCVIEVIATQGEKKRLLIFIDENGEQRVGCYNGFSNGMRPPPGTYCVIYKLPAAFHGTNMENLDSIFKNGLSKDKRDGVHMAINPKAVAGFRPGSDLIVRVDIEQMRLDGYKVYALDNGVIMFYGDIPSKYLTFWDKNDEQVFIFVFGDD